MYYRATHPVTKKLRCSGDALTTTKKCKTHPSKSTTAKPNPENNNLQLMTRSPQTTAQSMIETPSKLWGGIPSAVSDCAFLRDESQEYFYTEANCQSNVETSTVDPVLNNDSTPAPFVYDANYYGADWVSTKREFGPDEDMTGNL
jgi:hypothetical protein